MQGAPPTCTSSLTRWVTILALDSVHLGKSQPRQGNMVAAQTKDKCGGCRADLPAHDHIRLDCFSGLFEIGSGLLHIESDRVNFVSGGFGKTITSNAAGIGF